MNGPSHILVIHGCKKKAHQELLSVAKEARQIPFSSFLFLQKTKSH
jgi:hypothetical protein